MQKKIILIFLILFFGCEFKKEALGVENDLIVFTSQEDMKFTSHLIQKYFNSKGKYCPQFEPFFNIKFKTEQDLEEFHLHRNLLFLSLENPVDTTMDIFISKLNNSIKTSNPIFKTQDLYAYDQVIVAAQAKDAIHFQTLLDTNINWIHDQFLNQIEEKIWGKEVKKDKNEQIINNIKNWFELDVHISMDYIEVKEYRLNKFYWIGRVYPYRWITIHEIPLIEKKTPEFYWEKLDSLVVNTMENVVISEFYRESNVNKYKNRKVLSGVYGQTEANTGGPFISYIFENKENETVQFLTGYVNNPGKSKILMVKELELIFEHSNIITY